MKTVQGVMLVTGATGNVGRQVVSQLLGTGATVRALTRAPDAADLPGGVDIGPQSLTQVEQVRTIGEVIGRPLRYEEISPEAGRQQLLTEGWPPPFVDGALNYWAKLVTEPDLVTPMVQAVTGAPASTFREWAIDHAGDFR